MWLAKPIMDGQVSRYRRKAGPTPPQFMGFPTVLLTTVGAKTGKERTHVLGGFADGDDARPLLGLGRVDRGDRGVRHRAAQDGEVHHARQAHVVCPGGPPGDEVLVLLAPA